MRGRSSGAKGGSPHKAAVDSAPEPAAVSLLEVAGDYYWEQDSSHRFTVWRLTSTCSGVAAAVDGTAWLGKTSAELCAPPANDPDHWTRHRAQLEAREPFRDVVHTLPGPIGPHYLSLSGAPAFGSRGAFVGYRGIARDVSAFVRHSEARSAALEQLRESESARTEAERRVQYLTSHDPLTNLPNRATFVQLLAVASETARRRGTRFAVLLIDLDHFKAVNDTLGHEAGDLLLSEAAARLRSSVRASDVVARLGGDEFVVLLQDVPSQAVAERVAGGILAALRPPVVIHGNECALTASIGICLHPDGEQEDRAVLRNADMAMYLAKQSGKNGYRFYADALGTVAAERAAIETRLRSAWERGEYTLRYDAILDAASRSVVAFGARVHWTGPELAGAAPDTVTSVAEETGLIMRINQWALHTACAVSAAWQRAGLTAVRVAVAVGKAQLRDPKFLGSVTDTLEQVGLEARWLELEIGEESLRGDTERVALTLEALTSLGAKIALDAYGTGRSSLAALKRYPIDVLKLHGPRLAGVAADADKRRYVDGFVALAAALDLTVVATGVANEADADYLRRCGCAAWQGPLGPSGLSAGDCEKLLAARASPP
jgi:diguanylate cyclase (GGDEF)-like protein